MTKVANMKITVAILLFEIVFNRDSQGWLFDCTFPFRGCGDNGSGMPNGQPRTNLGSSGTETSSTREPNAGDDIYTTSRLNYTYTYTVVVTETSPNDNSVTELPSQLSEDIDNLKSVGEAQSLLTKISTGNFTNKTAVKAVNQIINALEDLSSSEPIASVESLVNIFDEVANYVEFMSDVEAEKFLIASSKALVNSSAQDDVKGVLVKVEEYAVTVAPKFLVSSNQSMKAIDTGSVNMTFCTSGSDECAMRSSNVAFEPITTEGLIVTFLEFNGLEDASKVVDSVVTSVTAQETTGRSKSIPVAFLMKHNQERESGVSSCVFLNISANEWSDDGCAVVSSNVSHTKCSCNHTTNFAVLFLHSNLQFTIVDEFWFNLMTYVGCGVSITALVSTMTIFVALRLHRSERVILLWQLCFCLSSAQLVLVAGTTAQVGTVGCKIIAILLHFFFTAAFSWMLMEGIHLYMKASNLGGGKYKFKTIIVCGWALPVLVVGISMAIDLDQYGSGNACWLSINNGFVWAFLGPALFIILINCIVLIFVIKVFLGLKSVSKTSEKERIKKATKAVLLLMPLLGITWIFGLLAFDESTKWFLYLFCICNSLQGLAIFILQCVKNDDVRKAFFRKYRRTFVSIGSYSSGTSSSSNKTNESYMHTDHPTRGLPTVARW